MKPEEKIYRAIGGTGEDLVREILEPPRRRRTWQRWGALAAALALVAGGGLALLPRFGGSSAGGAGHQEGSTFMSYAGPIFPLTVLEGGGELTAQRKLTLDFSGYTGEEQGGEPVRVTDVTQLESTAPGERTITVAYPFVASLSQLEIPTLTVNGEAVNTGLQAGAVGMSTGSWEDYQHALASGEYMEAAFREPPVLNQPVTVYRVYDGGIPEGNEAVAPHVAVTLPDVPQDTRIYSYGFNSFSFGDEGLWEFGYSIQEEGSLHREDPRLLIVQGEIPEGYTLRGTTDGSLDTELSGVEVWVETQETTLEEALSFCLEDFYLKQADWLIPDKEEGLELATRSVAEMVLPVASEEGTPEQYDTFCLEDVFSRVASMNRVFWATAQVTLPEEGAVEVKAEFSKDPSFDYTCANTQNRDIYGYDMVTTLGSALEFESVTLCLENTSGISIVRQNCGLDLDAGILEVELDPQEPRYYLEIHRAE